MLLMQPRRPRHHIDGILTPDLTEEEKRALTELLNATINQDCYPLLPTSVLGFVSPDGCSNRVRDEGVSGGRVPDAAGPVRRWLSAGGKGPPTNDQAKKSGAVTPRDTL